MNKIRKSHFASKILCESLVLPSSALHRAAGSLTGTSGTAIQAYGRLAILRVFIMIAICILLVLFAGSVAAQTEVTIDGMKAAATEADPSVKLFAQLFPTGFFLNPLSAVGGASNDSIIGNMFLVFNGAVFVIGVFWASYGIVNGIAQTAHSGEFLGKQMSVIWMPIRMVTGIVGIIPIFAGFSLAQVLLVTMAGLGIGLANLMWDNAIKSIDTTPPIALTAPISSSGKMQAAAEDLFKVHFCMNSYNNYIKNFNTLAAAVRPLMIATPKQEGNKFTVSTRAGADEINYAATSCGGASFTAADPSSVKTSGTGGFSVNSLDPATVNAMTKSANEKYFKAAAALNTAIASLAVEQYAKYTAGKLSVPPVNYDYAAAKTGIAAAVVTATTASIDTDLSAKVKAQSGLLQKQVKANMIANGWIGAGAWFSTIAVANSMINTIAKSMDYSYEDSISKALDTRARHAQSASAYPEPVAAEMAAFIKLSVPEQDANAAPATEGDMLDKIWRGLFPASSTGNLSMGQAIINWAIEGVAVGEDGLVNPIFVAKNIGDYSLVMGQVFMATGAKMEMIVKVAEKDPLISISKLIPVFGTGVTIAIESLAKVAAIILSVAPYFLVLGLMFGIYVPMIPFIVWMGAVTQYAVVVCQGLVGAPIAALAHLDAQGEGMGQRSEAGYMFLLNVTFRPALMILGFFLASGLLMGIGTLQVALFKDALANAQGNSLTGILSVIAYLAIYLMMNLTLIHGLFNMVFLLPDQVLALIGSQGQMADIGKESESGMKNNMLVMTRGTTEMARAAGAQKPEDKKPHLLDPKSKK